MTLKFISMVAGVLICGCLVLAKHEAFPSNIQRCQKSVDLNACILLRVQELKPRLKEGISELGIPTFDPIFIPKVVLNAGKTFNAEFSDIQVFGGTDFQLKKFELDVDDSSLSVHILFAELHMKCRYKIEGNLLFLQLRGDGIAEGNFTNISAKSQVNGFHETRNGQEFINFNQTKLNLEIGTASLVMSDLFKGNSELTQVTNRLINENIEEITTELKPFLEETVGAIVFGRVLGIFKVFSINELFPKDSN